MPQFTPLLVQGLKAFAMESLMTVSVGVTVDICAAIGAKLQPFADQVVGALMEVLRDSTVAREVKPTVVSAFGDVAMAIAAGYEPYLAMTVMLLMQAADQNPDSPEMVDFINSLRTSVLEAYSGLVVGLGEAGRTDLFVQYVPPVMQLLGTLTADTNKDDMVLTKAITLLGDMAKEIGAPVKQHLNQQMLMMLFNQAASSSDPEMTHYTNWSKQQLDELSRK